MCYTIYMKMCAKCNLKPKHKKLAYCHECQKQYVRDYNKTPNGRKNIYKGIIKSQRQKNGFPGDLFDEMLKSQNYLCAICGADKPSKSGKRDWHGDHNHDTGKARGILCAGCNTLLGRLESVGLDWVDKAKVYLKNA